MDEQIRVYHARAAISDHDQLVTLLDGTDVDVKEALGRSKPWRFFGFNPQTEVARFLACDCSNIVMWTVTGVDRVEAEAIDREFSRIVEHNDEAFEAAIERALHLSQPLLS